MKLENKQKNSNEFLSVHSFIHWRFNKRDFFYCCASIELFILMKRKRKKSHQLISVGCPLYLFFLRMCQFDSTRNLLIIFISSVEIIWSTNIDQIHFAFLTTDVSSIGDWHSEQRSDLFTFEEKENISVLYLTWLSPSLYFPNHKKKLVHISSRSLC